MSTYKTALRVVWAHKFYFLIYLVGMSAIMLVIGFSNMQAAVSATASSSVGRFEPARAKIALINRDKASEAGRNLGQGLEDYLKKSSDLVAVDDDLQSLQDANVSGKSDLTIIIPSGYGQQFLDKLNESQSSSQPGSAALPEVETAASYNSSRGSLAQLQIDAFFDGLRTASLTGLGRAPGAAQAESAATSGSAPASSFGAASTSAPASASASPVASHAQSQAPSPTPLSPADLKSAAAYTVSHYASNQPAIKVQTTSKKDAKTLAAGFAGTISLAAYPLMTALTVCVAILFGAFNSPDRHRRLLSSPLPTAALDWQELLAAFILAVVSWGYYLLAAVGSTTAAGGSVASLGWGRVWLSFAAMFVFALAAAAFGFMLSQFNPSSSVINAVGVIAGLLIMFTSGATSGGYLPTSMQTIGKLTPGWWYNSAVTAAMGVDSSGQNAATGSTGIGSWLAPLGLIALFALAYICVGLMASRLTRTRSTLAAATTSDPTLVG